MLDVGKVGRVVTRTAPLELETIDDGEVDRVRKLGAHDREISQPKIRGKSARTQLRKKRVTTHQVPDVEMGF